MSSRRAKKVLFVGLSLVLVGAAVEVASFLTYRLTFGAWFLPDEDQALRRALLAEGAEVGAPPAADWRPQVRVPTSLANQPLHPFLGFVHRYPGESTGQLRATPWGFLRQVGGPALDGAYRIGVVGGSAAFLFSFKGNARLREGLRNAPFVDGRPLEVISLAMGGYKQPQQLMTLAWLLSEGEHFDLIINLDGFNEVAFGAENVERGVYPSYPRSWWLRAGGRYSLTALEALGRAAVATSSRRRLAARFDATPFSRTATANLVWRLLDGPAVARIQRAEAAVAVSIKDELDYSETGPPFSAANDEELYGVIAARWRDASVQIGGLCRANNIRYVHLLQPNQYVAGSKPMGARERQIAIAPDHRRREAVEKGYPFLRAESGALRQAGVDFHDLTQLYSDVHEVIYADSCCHVNELGNEMISDYLVSVLDP